MEFQLSPSNKVLFYLLYIAHLHIGLQTCKYKYMDNLVHVQLPILSDG
jgi:hypothetical protein